MKTDNSIQKIPKLDFLRALSAAIVVVYHWGIESIPAGFGVLTFFVISGFLITYLLLRERERTGTISLGDFYARRSLRIFPAFYVYWCIAIGALVLTHKHIIWPQAICSFLYVANYYQGLHRYPSSLFSHTWSLGVEEQFYCLWPAAFLLLGRHSPRRLLRCLFVVIPLLWLYRIALHLHGVNEAYIYTSLETRIDAILVGCALSIILFTGAFTRVVAEARRTRYLPFVLLALGASIFGGGPYGVGYRNLFGFAIDPLLLALLIAQLTAMRGATWLDARPISYLGRISYSTYLYQQLVLPLVRPRLPHSLSLVGCLLCVWQVAALSYELVEKPFLKLKRRFGSVPVLDSRAQPAPSAPGVSV